MCLHSEVSGQAGGMGQQEPHGAQHGEVPGPALGEEQPQTPGWGPTTCKAACKALQWAVINSLPALLHTDYG